MKAVLWFLVISSTSILADMAGECDMAGFYLELGCTPVPYDKSPCPAAFNCPDLHPNPDQCYYRGKAYAPNAAIPQTEILASCSQACSCTVRGAPSIECASVDCVESFDSDIKQQCIDTYELDSCCSTGNVCGKDAIAQLATCEIDGKTYYEGQQYELRNTGKICICRVGSDGNVNNTECRDINCGLELHHQDDVMKKCAPVFYGSGRCPIDFKCPTENTKIIRALNIRNVMGECAFGNETLRIGDEVSMDDKCTVCKCEVPPFVACKQSNSCN